MASIRVRIVVGYMLLLTAALLFAVLVTRYVELARTDREFEREQAQEVEELRSLAGGVDPATGDRFGGDVAAIFDTYLRRNVPSDDEAFYAIVDGQPYDISRGSPNLFADEALVAAWSSVVSPTSSTADTDVAGIGEVRSLAVPILRADETVAGVFVVTSFPADDYGEVDQVVRLITLAGLAILAITSTLAWALARQVLQPVRELTDTARRISSSDLSARIPVEGNDELAELGTTFNAMVDRVEQGINAQRQFLDDVAHELRTPITIAKGHLEFVGDDHDERAETIEIVTDELDRMSRYVSDLLLLAKAEQPDFLVERPIDLREFILDLHERITGLDGRTWTLDEAPPVGPVAVADPDRLSQAMLNLAANAMQHTTEGDEIGVGLRVDRSLVWLWIRDTGPGVDPAVAASLFQRYTRAATSRTHRPDGTGIGLSIVDAIARAHGGTASVTTRVGEGATFTLAIPRRGGSWGPPIRDATIELPVLTPKDVPPERTPAS
ncbi:MAG: sensor histidine kinase [Ilumatobacteraceae bacterium]